MCTLKVSDQASLALLCWRVEVLIQEYMFSCIFCELRQHLQFYKQWLEIKKEKQSSDCILPATPKASTHIHMDKKHIDICCVVSVKGPPRHISVTMNVCHPPRHHLHIFIVVRTNPPVKLEFVDYDPLHSHSGPAHGLICPKCELPWQGSSFAGVMHSFAGMVHHEDTTWNIEQIPNSLDFMSIFLDSVLRD